MTKHCIVFELVDDQGEPEIAENRYFGLRYFYQWVVYLDEDQTILKRYESYHTGIWDCISAVVMGEEVGNYLLRQWNADIKEITPPLTICQTRYTKYFERYTLRILRAYEI